jgi:hypothetical protein
VFDSQAISTASPIECLLLAVARAVRLQTMIKAPQRTNAMETQNEGNPALPLAIQFVPGRVTDGATKSVIRSHAMAAFRSKQRHQKQLEAEQHYRPTILNQVDNFCRCIIQMQPLPCPPEPFRTRDLSSNPLENRWARCVQCGHVQIFGRDLPQQLAILQQMSPTIPAFPAIDFDPFGTMSELPRNLTDKYSREINAIKKHGSYTSTPKL